MGGDLVRHRSHNVVDIEAMHNAATRRRQQQVNMVDMLIGLLGEDSNQVLCGVDVNLG